MSSIKDAAMRPRTTTFIPDHGIREALEAEAKRLDRSLSWVINDRLRKSLEGAYDLPPREARL
jgi:hypothetical protein